MYILTLFKNDSLELQIIVLKTTSTRETIFETATRKTYARILSEVGWRRLSDERDNNDDGPDNNDGNVYKGDHGELLNDGNVYEGDHGELLNDGNVYKGDRGELFNDGNDENNIDNDHDSPENNSSGGGDDDDDEDDDKDPDVNINDEDEPDCESSAKKTWSVIIYDNKVSDQQM